MLPAAQMQQKISANYSDYLADTYLSTTRDNNVLIQFEKARLVGWVASDAVLKVEYLASARPLAFNSSQRLSSVNSCRFDLAN